MKPLPVHGEPLTVVMRVRPMNNKEMKSEAKSIVYPVDDKFIVLRDPNEDADDILRANRSREKQYIFDHVFSPEAGQKEVYETVVEEKNIIDTVLSGFNCTVFAYGATGTGKTHTMLGGDENPGIMVLTLNSLFRRMQETSDDKRYTVSIAYLEIYNENIRDLLCPDSGSLELREDANGSIVISNLLDISAESTEVVLGMLRMGNTNRTSEPTVANATSSRSHAILKVNVECQTRVSNVVQESHCGSLYMVDLAGSERAAVTQNRGKRLIEGAHINRSLLALANCINALGSNASNYINYRDSKLTRILKEALGGNCKTIMIAHVSPASSSYEETRNTMLYAERTKKIKNKARQNIVDVNHHVTQYLHIIGDLNLQIAKLKGELNRAELGGTGTVGVGVESEEVTGHCDRLKSLIMDQRILRQQVLDLEVSLVQTTVEWRQRQSYIREWEQKREEFHLATITAPSSTAPSPSPTLGAEETMVDADSLDLRHHVAATVTETDKNDSFLPVPTAVDAELSESSLLSPTKYISELDLPTIPTESHQGSGLTADTSLKHNSDLPASSPPTSAGQRTRIKELSRTVEKSLVKPRHVLPGGQLLVALGPEPDPLPDRQDNEETVDNSGEVTEPSEIQAAREELLLLQSKKEKMEKKHITLKKKLRLIKDSIDKTKEELACADGYLPTKKELVDLLLSFSDVEASSMKQSLSATLLRAHLLQQTFLIQQLLQHSASLLSLLERQRKLAERSVGAEGMSEEIAKDWDVKLSEASQKQRKLTAQVAELSSIKSDGIPTDLTAYTSGFKLDTSEESKDVDSESLGLFTEAKSDIHLPDIVQVKDDAAKKKYSIESSSLPPITVKASGTFGKTWPTEKKIPTSNQSSPLKKSDIDQIVEEAKRNRDKRNAVNLGDKAKKTSKQLQERSVHPRRKSYRVQAHQVVTTRSLVMGQAVPTASEVIDLETSDAPVAMHSESRSQLQRSDSSESLLQGEKSHSHSNFSAHRAPDLHKNNVPISMGERERNRKRIVKRVGSVSSSKSLPGTIETKKKNMQASNRVIISQNAVPPDKEWARKTKYWSTTAKPLVKKIAFSQRPDSQISPHPLNSSSGVGDSDSNSMSEKGITTDESTTDTTSQPARRKSRQRNILTRQPWRNRRRHGVLPHSSQLAKAKYPLASRKQLSLAKVVAGSQFSSIESPYQNAFPNANKIGTKAQGNTPRRKPLVRSQFPGDSSKI